MTATYTDKEVLEDALHSTKEATKLYNMTANECASPQLRGVVMDLLNQEHDLQFEVFESMHSRGMYPTPAATEAKINKCMETHKMSATVN